MMRIVKRPNQGAGSSSVLAPDFGEGVDGVRICRIVLILLVLESLFVPALGLPSMAADDKVVKDVRIPQGDNQY